MGTYVHPILGLLTAVVIGSSFLTDSVNTSINLEQNNFRGTHPYPGYMTSTVMEFPMDRAMEYRKLAEHIHVRASEESSSILKAEWDNLAETYTRLAEQSEAQDGVDVIYDPVFDVLGGFRR